MVIKSATIEVTTNVIGFDNVQIHFKVDEAILDKNQLAWFASCLVIGQVEKLKLFHLSCFGYFPMDKADKKDLYL